MSVSVPSFQQASTTESSTVDSAGDKEILRSQVVEVLSATANGCLNELGYFPGMPLRLQKSEQLNAQFRAENTKLYQDNCRLVKMVTFHQDSAKFLAASDSAKLQQFKELSEQVRILSEEPWPQRYAAIMEKYQRAVADYNHLQELHKSTLNEIALLHSQRSQWQQANPQSVEPTAVSMPVVCSKQDNYPNQNIQSNGRNPLTVPVHVPGARAIPISSATFPAAASTSTLRRSSGPTLGTQRYQPTSHPARPLIYVPTNPSTTSSKVSPRPISVNTHSSTASKFSAPTSAPPVLAPYYEIPTLSRPTPMAPVVQTAPSTASPSSLSTALIPQNSSLNPIPEPSRSKRKSLTPSTPAMSPGSHSSPLETVEALTPVESSLFTADLTAGKEFGPCFKKPRLQTQEIEHPTDPVDTKPDVQLHEGSDAEASDDEGIEVDAEGLRLPESCVAAFMEDDENEDGKKSCRSCHLRFEEGLISEAPKPFVRASLDELIQHCMDEHPAAWNLLRNDVG